MSYSSSKLILSAVCGLICTTHGFLMPQRCCRSRTLTTFGGLFATKDKLSSSSGTTESILDLEEPAGIVGAEFFGGSKQKEEFYDPVAEQNAGEDMEQVATLYERFQDTTAFETDKVARIAEALQNHLNRVLYDRHNEAEVELDVQFSSNLVWNTCFDVKSSKTPLTALKDSLDFYPRVDVAILSGKELETNRIQIHWQISVQWPIFWEPRVLLSGSSELTIDDNNIITEQSDSLDASGDLLSTISSQLKPRFWDVFHIGMSPSAEIMPRINKRGLLPKSYSVFEIPARLVTSPTLLDSEAGREDANAQIVPNHAFSCVIKTMGPTKQRFVPASPVEVQIIPTGQGSPPKLKWAIPLSVEFQSYSHLPIPGTDPEARLGSEPECQYEFQPRRRVATVAYGGTPQDLDIADVRKRLYEQVTKDGIRPKLDDTGRPLFFFLQNACKACYTDEGLGMCVYEWRPDFIKPNEIGIELEL